MTEKVKGRIKWFSEVKKYGFITADGQDYFLHISSIKDSEELKEGDDVEFEIEQSEKGFRAINVIRIIGE